MKPLMIETTLSSFPDPIRDPNGRVFTGTQIDLTKVYTVIPVTPEKDAMRIPPPGRWHWKIAKVRRL